MFLTTISLLFFNSDLMKTEEKGVGGGSWKDREGENVNKKRVMMMGRGRKGGEEREDKVG